ncbi:hypothetical protein [Glycomyces sp. YM15]|uniref:hypothetical protein n=1 Tax=Glycomyces sp. YM15 TaxID=2800446 RepID=UPI0019653B95|nr:hypothetical protein [Glycomyces sp. YM15]
MSRTDPPPPVRRRANGRTARLLGVAAALVMIATLSGTATAAEAGAQANLCGASYTRIDTYVIGSASDPAGYVELYWSSTEKRNCALAIGTGSTYGWKGLKAISICPSGYADGSLCGDDSGDFLYYAGPARTKAGFDMSGKCIDVYGLIERRNGQGAVSDKRRVHCG